MRSVCLLSSGIDSPAAAYMMASREIEVILLHMDNFGQSDTRTVEVVKRIAEVLRKATGGEMPLYIAPYHAFQERIRVLCDGSFQCVLCKRFMLRIARELAVSERARAIITGDSLGQVASQTLQNIIVEQRGLELPVLRPLIGLDKIEIEAIAKEVGTYELSITKLPGCRYVPRKPRTSATERSMDIQESRLEPEAALEGIISRIRRVDL